MRFLTLAVVLSVLLVCLHGQSSNINQYTLQGQTFNYIYGSGPSGASTTTRADTQPLTYVPDSTYQPPVKGPTPQTVVCSFNQVYDNVLCKCVCLRGFFMNNGRCYPNVKQDPLCGRNQVYLDKRCVCGEGYDLIGTFCDVCPPYSTYNVGTLSCKCLTGYLLVNGQCRQIYVPPPIIIPPSPPQCRVNERLQGNICVCLPDFYLVKGVCTYCVSPNFYDPQLAICRPTCRVNEQLDLNTLRCICLSGFNDIMGECGQCPAYSAYNKATRTCDCITGYTFSSGQCIPKTTPPLPPIPLPIDPRPCADINAVFLFGQCVCKTAYHLIGGVCQRCPLNTFYDATLKICRIPCQANEVYNIIKSTCECATKFYRINGICTECKGNSTFSAALQICVCPQGYKLDPQGNCILGCGINQVLSNGKCCCITGFYPIQGICGQCAWNEVYDQGLGICRVPCEAKKIFEISTLKCVCLPQYFELDDGQCGTCPLQSTYDEITKTCVCNTGYIKNLGLCTPACNAYEVYVNGKCVCKEGYYLIGYSCGLCPPTQIYDSIYRICHTQCLTNEIWDPTIRACRCKPGYYLIQGICGQCDSRTQVYKQQSQCCNCIEGYKRVSGQGCNGVCKPICSVNEDWILNRCVCKPGYYLINNFCTQCPSGQFYDVYQRVCRIKCGTNQVYNFNSGNCDCAQGFYIVMGICSKCQADETYDEYTQTCSIVPCKDPNEYYSPTVEKCVCKENYVKIKGVCTNCPPGYYYDAYSDRCLCKPGYIDEKGFCNPVCTGDQIYVNGRCQCKNGLPLYKGKCIAPRPCPLNAHIDKDSGCCVCDAGFRVVGGKCSNYQYCGVNGYLKYGQCYCSAGFFWILGACRACGQNEAYNGVACQCLLGYIRNINGQCVKSTAPSNCYKNERYDSILKACVCIDGTQFVRGRCIIIPTCPANAYYNSVSCVCLTGFIFKNGACETVNPPVITCPTNSYFNGVSCTCNLGFFQQALNSCAPCPSGQTFDGQRCVTQPPTPCAAGYVLNAITQQCEPSGPSCGDYSYWNGATCVCVTDYHRIGGVCRKCGSGQVFDGEKCAVVNPPQPPCGSNQVRINGKCVCNDGLYLIDGNCLACPAFTTWNGKFCQCGCDTERWCLGQPFSLWDVSAKTCGCQAGYTLVNGLCITF